MRIRISVRNLVEFIMRSGSIDSRYTGVNRLEEGARIHRKLQKEGGENYLTEVFLRITETNGGTEYTVEGRADGIILSDYGATIDEIKSTVTPLENIDEDYSPVHWAQAMCYGYIYSTENSLPEIDIRLTYYEMETGGIKRFTRGYTNGQLRVFFMELLDKYSVWAEFERRWKKTAVSSMQLLEFPHRSYRAGQRRLAAAVYRTIAAAAGENTANFSINPENQTSVCNQPNASGTNAVNSGADGEKDANGNTPKNSKCKNISCEKLFAMAPTGIGKTVSTLFPAIKAIGEGYGEKLFYLTARTVTRQAAAASLRHMRENGLRLKSVVITAKDKICPLEERVCRPDYCKYADGHFDRINDVVMEVLWDNDDITAQVISDYAARRCVCPFELSLDLTLWCDAVICDYNYLFDPQVYLKRFFSDGGDYIFLIDEAHNLADRAREMYSASVSKSDFLAAKKLIEKKYKALRGTLTRINAFLLEKRKEQIKSVKTEKEPPKELCMLLEAFIFEFSKWLGENPNPDNALLETYFNALTFLKIAEFFNERYSVISETGNGGFCVKLFCADPSQLIAERLNKGRAAVFFSATLTPAGYFSSVLGGGDNYKYLALPSPFPRENLLLLIANNISTKYRDRENSIKEIADLIYRTAEAKTGNYIVYFPSYSYLSGVYTAFCEHYPNVKTVRQQSGMTEEERDGFLALFDGGGQETLVAFCVLGGIFSEGIDLSGDKLLGAVIVGVGLPQINTELDIVKDYYGGAGTGFDFAYRFPGMNKVLQALGRVIRSESDKGVVLLIDERFLSRQYTELLPEHLRGYHAVGDIPLLKEALNNFWGNSTGIDEP